MTNIQTAPTAANAKPLQAQLGRAFNSLAVALPQRFIGINRSYKITYRPMQINKNHGTISANKIKFLLLQFHYSVLCTIYISGHKWPSGGLPTAIHTFRNVVVPIFEAN